jgi:1-aminocyclopropane-1-carboxylate deaminase/D-cysteine desulfhydrase-like pyridoxal-dependent ACC family enzyme
VNEQYVDLIQRFRSKEALETMARMEGMVLDPVYTAKVARGMMHWVSVDMLYMTSA